MADNAETKDAEMEVQEEEVQAEAEDAEMEAGEEDEAAKDGEDVAEKGDAEEEKAADAKDGEAEEEEKKEEEEVQEEAKEPSPPKEPEPPKELEEDAAADSRAKLAAGAVAINAAETTLNVMTSCEGKILMTLSEGGFQHLAGCGRAGMGVKAGRYLFEVKIVETRTPMSAGGRFEPMPRHLLRLGFSTAASPLFLEGSAGGIFFDSEGHFATGEIKEKVGRKFQAHQVLGVLLNLDPESPNANTISLFADGERVSQPKALPEAMHGQTLFPTVNFKSMTLHLNFGPEPFAPLPFKCRMLQDAAKADTVEAARKAPTAGTREVLFPVGLPDQGTFAWLDNFLKDNPHYTELSERSILEWAEKSNIYRSGGYTWKNSNDRPGLEFGIREMDDGSIKSLLGAVAPVLNRDYVKMEVRGNLIESDRKAALSQFDGPDFKKVAVVVMGEPPKDFKAKAQAALLEEKRNQAEEDAKKEFEKAKREKKEKPEKPKKEKKEGEDADAEDEEMDEEVEEKEDTLEEVVAKAREAVELSDAEQEQWFQKPAKQGDLVFKDLASSFSTFSIPTKEEGFDEIRYVWQKEEACGAYLKQWILEQKLTQRVEDLEPGSWFKDQWSEWHHLMQGWRQKQGDWKDSSRRPPQTKNNGEQKKEEEKKDEPKEEKKDDEKAEGAEKEDKEMEDGGEEKKDEEKVEEKVEDEKKEEEKEKEPEAPEIVTEDLDVWLVQDVNDVGNGEPLFANFSFEDWTLLGLRFELHCLVHAFKRDMNDPDRPSFHETHLMFYHSKYFRKDCSAKNFGCSTDKALLEMLRDTIELNPKSILEPMLSDDTPLDNFVKITEDERRERQRRMDAGDESAALNIMRPPPSDRNQAYGAKGRGGKGGGYNDRGGSAGKGDSDRQRASGGGAGYDRDRGHQGGDRAGYSSRGGPPPAQSSYSRGAPPPASRGPPPGPPSRYTSSDPRGGGGHSGGGHSSSRDHGPPRGADPRGAPRDAGRYGGGGSAPMPPPRGGSSYGPPPASHGGSSYGAQKRGSYPPPASAPPSSRARTDNRGPPPSSRGGSGGGSYGGGGGSSHGGGSGGGGRR